MNVLDGVRVFDGVNVFEGVNVLDGVSVLEGVLVMDGVKDGVGELLKILLVFAQVPQPGKSKVRVTVYRPIKVWLLKLAAHVCCVVVPPGFNAIEGAAEVMGEVRTAAGGGLLVGLKYVLPANLKKSKYMVGA